MAVSVEAESEDHPSLEPVIQPKEELTELDADIVSFYDSVRVVILDHSGLPKIKHQLCAGHLLTSSGPLV